MFANTSAAHALGIALTAPSVKAAEENNKLTHGRQKFAVDIVLETALAEQELTRARTVISMP
ncbi:MAG: hypothetical protein JWO08_1563 [Verrucomicrobiaceae bacterium]|nr:hypothetical protein [Verrucomicrobiaceae bacterium]